MLNPNNMFFLTFPVSKWQSDESFQHYSQENAHYTRSFEYSFKVVCEHLKAYVLWFMNPWAITFHE